MEKLLQILEELKLCREEVANKDIEAIVEEKVALYRESVRAEVVAEKQAELMICDIRLETAEKIYEELSAVESVVVLFFCMQ